jgi:hypothetical protein
LSIIVNQYYNGRRQGFGQWVKNGIFGTERLYFLDYVQKSINSSLGTRETGISSPLSQRGFPSAVTGLQDLTPEEFVVNVFSDE